MTTPNAYLYQRGFGYAERQPSGATDYVHGAGVFQVRVRIPVRSRLAAPAEPGLWVGFTAGGPLVERRSIFQYKDLMRLADDAVVLTRILRGL